MQSCVCFFFLFNVPDKTHLYLFIEKFLCVFTSIYCNILVTDMRNIIWKVRGFNRGYYNVRDGVLILHGLQFVYNFSFFFVKYYLCVPRSKKANEG